MKKSATVIYLVCSAVLDLGLISIASLGTRESTKVESHVNFTEFSFQTDIFFLQC